MTCNSSVAFPLTANDNINAISESNPYDVLMSRILLWFSSRIALGQEWFILSSAKSCCSSMFICAISILGWRFNVALVFT